MTVNNEQLTKILTDFSQQNEQLLKLQHQLTIAQQKLSTGDWEEWETSEGLTTYINQLITQIPTEQSNQLSLETKINELKSDNKVLETEQQRLTQLLTNFRQQKKDLKEQVKTLEKSNTELSEQQEKEKIINTSYETLLKDKDKELAEKEQEIKELIAEINTLKADLETEQLKILLAHKFQTPNFLNSHWKELFLITGLGIGGYYLLKE